VFKKGSVMQTKDFKGQNLRGWRLMQDLTGNKK
jgi:hypothetical protein